MSLSKDATFLERTQSKNKDKNYITYSENIKGTKKMKLSMRTYGRLPYLYSCTTKNNLIFTLK